jgi:hypothetical protein
MIEAPRLGGAEANNSPESGRPDHVKAITRDPAAHVEFLQHNEIYVIGARLPSPYSHIWG